MRYGNKKRRRKDAVLALALALCLTACGSKPKESTGLVSQETLKNYEHTVRLEPTADPTPSASPDKEPSNTPTPSAPPADDGEYEETNDMVYVAVSKLNLRSGPSMDSEIVGKAVFGDSFTRVAKGKGEWDKLLFEGQIVYAFAEYLSTKNVSAQEGETDMKLLAADVKKK